MWRHYIIQGMIEYNPLIYGRWQPSMYESCYINMNSQGDFGDHAVHKDGWGHMPADRLYLWAFILYHPAVEQARISELSHGERMLQVLQGMPHRTGGIAVSGTATGGNLAQTADDPVIDSHMMAFMGPSYKGTPSCIIRMEIFSICHATLWNPVSSTRGPMGLAAILQSWHQHRRCP